MYMYVTSMAKHKKDSKLADQAVDLVFRLPSLCLLQDKVACGPKKPQSAEDNIHCRVSVTIHRLKGRQHGEGAGYVSSYSPSVHKDQQPA